MKPVLRWLAAYWYIPLFIGGVLALWAITGFRRTPPIDTVTRELAVIRAGAAAREAQLLLGKKRAAEQVQREKAVAIAQLQDKQAAKAEELRDDPVALSRFLVRAGRPDA